MYSSVKNIGLLFWSDALMKTKYWKYFQNHQWAAHKTKTLLYIIHLFGKELPLPINYSEVATFIANWGKATREGELIFLQNVVRYSHNSNKL